MVVPDFFLKLGYCRLRILHRQQDSSARIVNVGKTWKLLGKLGVGLRRLNSQTLGFAHSKQNFMTGGSTRRSVLRQGSKAPKPSTAFSSSVCIPSLTMKVKASTTPPCH